MFKSELDDAINRSDVILKNDLTMLKHISNIRNVISEHGISQALIKAVDPNGELISLGVYSSLESLPIVPSKDCNEAVVAIEGLDDIVKKLAGKVKNDFKQVGSLFGSFFSMISKNFKSWTVDLENAESKMKNVEVDEDKLSNYQTKALSKTDFKELGESISEVFTVINAEKIEALTKDIKNLSLDGTKFAKTVANLEDKLADFISPLVDNATILKGMDIHTKISRQGLPIITYKVTNKSESATVSRLNWKYNDIVDTIEEAKHYSKAIKAQIENVQVIFDLIDKIAIMNGEFVDQIDVDVTDVFITVEKERIMLYSQFSSTLYDFCTIIYKLLSVCVYGYFEIYQNTPVTLAKAVIKTSK